MTTTEFQVTGMSCGHCERAIRDEVEAIPGVTAVEVDAATGHLSVTTEATEATETTETTISADVIRAVDEAGYSAVPR